MILRDGKHANYLFWTKYNKIKISNRRKTENFTTTEINNMLLNNHLVKEEVKKEVRKYQKTNENVYITY
jgi:hypothetical protein